MDYKFEKNEHINSYSPISIHYNILGEGYDVISIPHCHEAIELIYLKKGQLKCKTDFYETTVEEGNVLYINPYVSHYLENITPSCYLLCIKVDISIVANHNVLLNSSSSLVTNAEPIVAGMNIIENENKLRNHNYKIIIESQILSILAYVNRFSSVESSTFMSNSQFNKIRKSLKYINEHLNENISVKDISSYVGFSESHFSRCFHSVTKMSVVSYINLVRCNHAYYLISTMNKSVKEAAELSGFSNMSYFTKKFKETHGIQPSNTPKSQETIRYI